MKILHSGFDSIYFALQGALEPWAIKQLDMAKERAVKEDRDISIRLGKAGREVQVKSSGSKGGYAFVISTGALGEVIRLKRNLGRENWNGFAEISAAALAVHKRKQAIDNALKAISEIGFIITDVSFNRIDYCIDFLTDNLSIAPENVIAHSRAKKAVYYRQETPNNDQLNSPIRTHSIALDERPLEPTDNPIYGLYSPIKPFSIADTQAADDPLDKRAVMRGQSAESITIGTMPGRQVIIYDKKAQVIAKRKNWWFDVWGLDRALFRVSPALTVTRVEIRAGKLELGKYGIKSQNDFENHIGNVLQKITKQIRYVSPTKTDTNMSRQPLHPLWELVQMHLNCELEDMTSKLDPEVVLNTIRAQKVREYESQIIGNMAGLAVCDDTAIEKVIEELPERVAIALLERSMGHNSPFWKAYYKAKDRLKF